MHVRAEVIRPAIPAALRLPTASAVRNRGRSLDIGAGLLGALTTAGLLLLSAVIMLATLLLAMRRGADAVATGLTDASITTNLLMALLLGAIVLVAFATGGYVAARLAPAGGRLQGVVVWALAMVVPLIGIALAAGGNGTARTVLDAVTDDGAIVTLALSAMLAGLLGALLGADAVERRGATPVPRP